MTIQLDSASFATQALHAGSSPDPATGAILTPLRRHRRLRRRRAPGTAGRGPAGKTRALIVIASLSRGANGEVVVLLSVAGNGSADVLIDVMGFLE